MSVSGWFLLFPYLPANVTALQFWTVIHAVIAMLFVAAMLAHIYIGSIGMEGAFDAMGTGEVDLNWAKEHHASGSRNSRQRVKRPPKIRPARCRPNNPVRLKSKVRK
jgi:formate dehydrogenase subunit gamma